MRLPGGVTKRKDLHGFCDLKAMNDHEEVYLQVTSTSNISARLRKIQHESIGHGQWRTRVRDLARMILGYGHARIVIEGWKLDRKKYRYVDTEREVTLEDLK